MVYVLCVCASVFFQYRKTSKQPSCFLDLRKRNNNREETYQEKSVASYQNPVNKQRRRRAKEISTSHNKSSKRKSSRCRQREQKTRLNLFSRRLCSYFPVFQTQRGEWKKLQVLSELFVEGMVLCFIDGDFSLFLFLCGVCLALRKKWAVEMAFSFGETRYLVM